MTGPLISMQPLRQSLSIFSSETAYYFRKRSRFAGPVVSRTRWPCTSIRRERERERDSTRYRLSVTSRGHAFLITRKNGLARFLPRQSLRLRILCSRLIGMHLSTNSIQQCSYRSRIYRCRQSSLIAQLSHFHVMYIYLRGWKISIEARFTRSWRKNMLFHLYLSKLETRSSSSCASSISVAVCLGIFAEEEKSVRNRPKCPRFKVHSARDTLCSIIRYNLWRIGGAI